MKWLWRTGVAAGGVLIAASLTTAQIPGGAAAPAALAPAAAVPGAAVVPGAAPAPTGFFGKMCANLAVCRQKLCASPLGQFLNSGMAGPSFITGGIIPPLCPIMPSLADLAKPGVSGTADAIKKDALEAQARRMKVRFLGTVDCRYYPDAIGALTAALRTDASECVRFEAALALNRGCCCNRRTIDALVASVSGTEKDGNPAERSVRVRCVAAMALERCLSCYSPPPVEVDGGVDGKGELRGGPDKGPPPIESVPGKVPGDVPPMLKLPETGSNSKDKENSAASEGMRQPTRKEVAAAWRILNDFHAMVAASHPQAAIAPGGERNSIYAILKNSAVAPQTPTLISANVPENAMAQAREASIVGRSNFDQPYPTATSTSSPNSPPPIAGQPPRAFVPDAMPNVSTPLTPKPATTAAPPIASVPPVAAVPPVVKPTVPIAASRPDATHPTMPMAPTMSSPGMVTPPMTPTPAPRTLPINTTTVAPKTSMTPTMPVSPTTSARPPMASSHVSTPSPVAPIVAQVINGTTALDRHTAIRQLVRYDWQQNPVVASALVAGAKNDPVPAVRVDCLRHLAAYHVSHPQVLVELSGLTKDGDVWVRDEAAKAYSQLKSAP